MKKPGKSLPDTNTIIRYLVRDDESLYLKAKDFFAKHADKPVSHAHRSRLEKLLHEGAPTYSSLMRLFAGSDSHKHST